MKSSSFAITLLFAKVNALSLRRADAGVPVTVNPTLMNNTMGDVPLGLNMTVGPDSVQVSQQKLAQGVPVHVVPTLMTDTMHDAKLDMKIVVGPDEVELKKKQSLAQGPPVFVNPTKAINEMESASMELPGMKVGGNTVTAAQVKGVPVHVVPTLMTDTMHDAKLDMKIVVGPDEVELKKKQLQQLVQQSSKKYSDMKEGDLEAVVKKALLAEPPKAKDADEAKKTVDDMKAVEDALGKRILDRLSGYGW